MRYLLTTILIITTALQALSQDAVTWKYRLIGDNTEHPAIEMTAKIQPGYHLYDINNPAGGSNPLEFFFETEGCKTEGTPVANVAYTKEYDDVFEVEQYFYSGSVTFTQALIPTAADYSVSIEIKGQACNDSGCSQVYGSRTLKGTAPIAVKAEQPVAAIVEPQVVEAAEPVVESIVVDTVASEPVDKLLPSGSWWDNVEAELNAFSDNPEGETRSLWYILIAGFLGGLIALVTPCVWPLIPMTVSFFLKQNKTRRKSIVAASTYGASIVIIYVAVGLAVTILFGASALNELATSALFNIIFFLLLVLFGISFLGGFNLTLPSSWSNKMDSKVESTTGYLSIFFMAFTLVLVSFSCTGPIIGTLLVEAAATSNFVSPAVGMLGFSLALALPFTLFAIFPTVLKSMPRSGGWLNTVKVVLGFLELALALKFLSVADLAYGWRILDREVFVSLWIVIFALLGMYLLGKLRFPHDDAVEKVSVTRFMLACVSLSFAIYMLPGLWGAPLKSISAFSPPISTQDFSLYTGEVSAQVDDYEEGMELGRKLGKPVLVDFSGYGCVNCRKMEGAVWTDPDIKRTIEEDYVLVTLMVDEKRQLPEPIKVTESDGTQRTLRTYGDKWSYLQRSKFGANAQPYHVIVDQDGKPLAAPFVYKEDIPGYKRFLQQGLDGYVK